MSPAWALEAGSGGAVPTPPPAPPSANMMFWAHGYGGGIVDAGGVVSKVFDFAGQNQDLDFTEGGKEPQTGVYTIDGRPTWSMGLGSTGRYIRRASTMLDSNGAPLAPSAMRTFWSVFLPKTGNVGFDITGGPLFGWQEAPSFQPLFDLESFFHPDGFYLFDTAWRFDGDEIRGPDTPAATYANLPQIVTWIGAANAGAPIKVYRNGVLIATSPATSGGIAGAGNTGFVSGNCPNVSGAINNVPFQGGIGEQIAYDVDQSLNPTAFAQTLAYLQAFYPTAAV